VKAAGKGRPTPKRREAEKRRRQPVTAPTSRRQAAKQLRARQRDDRVRMRQALASGDTRNLPARDAGPVKAFVRDFVDTRRGAATLFMPLAIVTFLLGLLPSPLAKSLGFLLLLVMIVLVIVDLALMSRQLRKALAARFPNENTSGTTWYAATRALQIRRLRLPPARLKRGETP
jgi:hypothetical protein